MSDPTNEEIGFPELDLTKEEEALLAKMEAEETGVPVVDEEPEPEKEPEPEEEAAKEPEPAPEPVVEPGGEPAPVQAEAEPEPKPEKPEYTNAELLERMESQERDIAGLRGDLFKERDRRRTAEAKPEEKPAEEEVPEGVEIEMNAEGNYQVPLEGLTEQLRKRGWTPPGQVPQAGGQIPPQQEPGAAPPSGYQPGPPGQDMDPRRAQFEQMRAGIVQQAESPLETGKAMDTLLEATLFLDQRVGEELPKINLDQVEPGIGRIAYIVENTNIGKELAEKFPGIDPVDLSAAALSMDPLLVRRTLTKYMEHGQAPAERDAAKDELAVRRQKLTDRPRSMAKKGSSGAQNIPNAEYYANLTAQDVFDMSDEDMAEMERQAKGDS